MAYGTRAGLILVAGLMAVSSPAGAVRQQGAQGDRPLPDFDIRDQRPPAAATAEATAELQRRDPSGGRTRQARLHGRTGAIRVLDYPGLTASPLASAGAIARMLGDAAARLGLEPRDFAGLELVRDYVSASTRLRHVAFAQTFDGIPVFDAVVTVHLAPDGTVVRLTSSASAGSGRSRQADVAATVAAARAAASVRPDQAFSPALAAPAQGPRQRARFARGPFARELDVSLAWLPVDGRLRLAWHVGIEAAADVEAYDLLVDAGVGDVLVRRSRAFDADGSGRVVQSAATRAADPRRPDPSPTGDGGCPPVANHDFISLNGPFRDSAAVLAGTGRLEGNNAHAFHLNTSTEAPSGVFDGTGWSFDFPFNTAGAAATTLFHAMNYVHDFFYDLGFDEAAGNFQQDNFGRGGTGNDRVNAVARASGRNNATYLHAVEGSSPTISMFLWDGTNCWGEDVDGDGTLDLDGDYDLDIVIHEFHHGVTHRLNTAFTGAEAGAMGEGGGDFFAYSVHNDPFLAEFARPGGLRSINSKTYADWFCFLGIICSVHDNGQIFANVLWDVRERFRGDNVRGSEQAAINELHQLYIDALKLSPPTPTMLDLRDAILLADQVRNPGSPTSQNFCRIWEPFAGRGMGLHATDTEDNGVFQVGPDTSVPDGCQGPPPPPTVTLTVSAATATEAGPTSGRFTISRSAAQSSSLLVSFTLGGTALNGTDYVAIPTTVTIPAGAASATVEITPIDDTLLESNETVVMSLRAGSGYAIGSPSSGTVAIVSDDLAPDFVVSGLTAPLIGGAGLTLDVSDTTANQGTGAGEASVTSFYLSLDVFLDAADPSIGSRNVPALGAGASNTASTTLAIPDDVTSGIYRIFARADGPAQFTELNEGNNLRSVSVRIGPDLTVSALSAPAAVGAGGSFVVTDTTANTGGGGAGSSQTRYYLSANSLLDAADPAIGSRGVGALAPGATHSGTATLTVPAGTETGLYYLFAKADGGDVVTEAIENNNTRLAWISVGPDLTISTITGPTRAAGGGTITVTDITRNSGAGNAGASTTAFYLSSNYLLDSGDIRLGATRSVPALAAGASSMGNTTVTLPNVTAGLWYLLAAADDLGGIAETSEVNNTRYYFVSIGPDLQVASLVAPSSVAAGSTMTITDSIRNIGLNVAGASVTRFYLSLNTVVDASDTFLGERAVGSIGVGATNTGSASVVVPAGLSGLYYLLAVADGANVVAESSETNNNGLRAISVNPQ